MKLVLITLHVPVVDIDGKKTKSYSLNIIYIHVT